jgi:hypothetical protein
MQIPFRSIWLSQSHLAVSSLSTTRLKTRAALRELQTSPLCDLRGVVVDLLGAAA